jgi:hypothetical protein
MTNDELHWLACRYAAGELTAEEEQAFELRLAGDQTAREAVEEAVELSEAIRLASAEPLPVRRPVRLAYWSWTAAAATLLLAVGLYWLLDSPSEPGNGKHDGNLVQDSRPGAEMTRAWVELRDRQHEGLPEAPPLEPVVAAEDLAETEVSVPQWMIVAFSSQKKKQ